MQNEADNGQGQSGNSGGKGGLAESDTPVLASPPLVQVDGVDRRLASSARRSKPLDRAELMLASPGRAPPQAPSAASLRAKCPPVLDQDPIGSCAAFAFTGALRFLHASEGLDEPLSPLFCYYATRVLIEVEQTGDDSGCKADAVVEALENYGVCVESAWPYDAKKFAIKPPAAAFDDAAKRKLTKAYRVTTLRAMKLSIAGGYPVPVAFPVARSVGYGSDAVPSQTWRTGIFPVPSSAPGSALAGSAGTSASSAGGAVSAAGSLAGSAGTSASSAGGAVSAAGSLAGSAGTSASSAGGAVSAAGSLAGSAGTSASSAGGAVSAAGSLAGSAGTSASSVGGAASSGSFVGLASGLVSGVGISHVLQPAADPADGYHFVLAIGYDDATGLVEIENSWGPKFGDNGYGYLPYAFFGPTQDTLIADPSVLAEDPWTLRHQSDEALPAIAAR